MLHKLRDYKCALLAICCIGVTALSTTANAAANRDNRTCGIVQGEPLYNAYGPWDFTNPDHQKKLPIVLGAHFTPQVERLISGNRGSLISDIDYTLRAIPNYHRALVAVGKYERRSKTKFGPVAKYYTAECYFKRAMYFQPHDSVPVYLYAIHLHMLKRHEEAENYYLKALTISPNNPEISYNLGLLYVDLEQLDKAQKHAKLAYDFGYPLDGLKNRLARAGVTLE